MKLEIYMKSGNVIKLDNVDGWEMTVNGEDVTYFKLNYLDHKPGCGRLSVTSLNLRQIEGVIQFD